MHQRAHALVQQVVPDLLQICVCNLQIGLPLWFFCLLNRLACLEYRREEIRSPPHPSPILQDSQLGLESGLITLFVLDPPFKFTVAQGQLSKLVRGGWLFPLLWPLSVHRVVGGGK